MSHSGIVQRPGPFPRAERRATESGPVSTVGACHVDIVTCRTAAHQPLVRVNGELRPASWDEALGRAADGFRAIRDTHGGQSIGIFSCSKSTNEMNFIVQKLARVAAGTNNIDSCNRT